MLEAGIRDESGAVIGAGAGSCIREKESL